MHWIYRTVVSFNMVLRLDPTFRLFSFSTDMKIVTWNEHFSTSTAYVEAIWVYNRSTIEFRKNKTVETAWEFIYFWDLDIWRRIFRWLTYFKAAFKRRKFVKMTQSKINGLRKIYFWSNPILLNHLNSSVFSFLLRAVAIGIGVSRGTMLHG